MSAVLFAYFVVVVECFYLNAFYVSKGLLWFPYFVGKDWFPLDVTVAWYITLVYKQLLFSRNSDFILKLQMRWTVDTSVYILYILCNLIHYGKHLSVVLMINLPIFYLYISLPIFYIFIVWWVEPYNASFSVDFFFFFIWQDVSLLKKRVLLVG